MVFYATIDSSIYKTCNDKDGESENSVVITPRLVFGKNCVWPRLGSAIDIDTFTWKVLKVNSSFTNAINKQSFATITPLTSEDEEFVAYKVSNIQEGEVIYAQVGCAISDSGRPGALTDYDYKFGNVMMSNQVAYRGDPINTRFKIWTTSSGKLEEDYIYDAPIEKSIQLANSNWVHFFAEKEATANGSRENIHEFLDRWTNVNDSSSDFKSRKNQTFVAGTNGAGNVYKKRTSASFARDETVLYAHGRSLDMESIRTLLYQNPSNSISRTAKLAPDFDLFIAAVHNRRRQNTGYNAIKNPLFNPFFIPREPSLLHFPGRSGHAAGGNSTGQECGDVTYTYTWTPPGYPECPGLSYDSASPPGICDGSASTTKSFCYDTPCEECS
jgi:hypothetical protein